MDYNGIYYGIDRYSKPDRYVEIDGNIIRFFHRELRSDNERLIEAEYVLKEDGILSGTECFEMDVTVGDIPKPDFELHIEKLGDKEIPIVSSMVFESDGRGRIVFETFVKAKDRELLGDDFESSLRKHLNNRSSVPMSKAGIINNNNPSPMSFMGMAGMMGMPQMPMNNAVHRPSLEAWDCSCGEKGNTGRFCLNCGKPVTQ